MQDPHKGQRVWVTGLTGTFTVTAVDAERRTVDLEAIDTHAAVMSIPFDRINPVGGDIGQSRFR